MLNWEFGSLCYFTGVCAEELVSVRKREKNPLLVQYVFMGLATRVAFHFDEHAYPSEQMSTTMTELPHRLREVLDLCCRT